MMRGYDATSELSAAVRAAYERRRPLQIVGGGTKAWYGRSTAGDLLSVAQHTGIVAYDPSELVITARAGTPLSTIEAALAEHQQMLGFEPPRTGPGSTLGGVVAAGLSGPRRPFAGAVRDFVLGAKVLDGRGDVLQFGGVVFKNVAGFDAFRLMAGALGCLGVLLEISLRVVPMAACERAVVLQASPQQAKALLQQLQREGAPLSGACFDAGSLHLRFSGGRAAVEQAIDALPCESAALQFWEQLRDYRHEIFAPGMSILRIALPVHARGQFHGHALYDWAGAQCWLRTNQPLAEVRASAAEQGGHAMVFRGPERGDVFAPLSPQLMQLHQRLKAALDPGLILNPGRMYATL